LLLQCLLVAVFCAIKYGLRGHKMGLHATYGDGTEISPQEMTEIRQAIHQNMVYSRWQRGDMLWIDNFRVSHGRQPTYDKGRKVVVAWADPVRKANAVHHQAVDSVVASKSTVEPELVREPAVSMENPQERTPESTLTKQESSNLHDDLQDKILLQEAVNKLLVSSENPQDMELNDQTLQVLKNMVAQAEARNKVTQPPPPSQHTKRLSATTPDFWQPED